MRTRDDDDVVRFEDDDDPWKLDAPWTDFEREPSSDSRERLPAPLKEDACSVTAMSWHDVVVAR